MSSDKVISKEEMQEIIAKPKVVVPKFESAKITAKIRFIGPDGIMRKFDESHIVAMALEDPKVKGKIWRLGIDDETRESVPTVKK